MSEQEICKGCAFINTCIKDTFQAHLKDGIFSCYKEGSCEFGDSCTNFDSVVCFKCKRSYDYKKCKDYYELNPNLRVK